MDITETRRYYLDWVKDQLETDEDLGLIPKENILKNEIFVTMERLKIQVWDPQTKKWQLRSSGNPVWIFRDLLIHPPSFWNTWPISPNFLDEDSFKKIAAYCDELIIDSLGDIKPRYSLNLIIREQGSRRDCLKKILAIFNGRLTCVKSKVILKNCKKHKDKEKLKNENY